MRKTYCFDMDGTIANLYGVENWLEMLINGDSTPYEVAKPLVNLSRLARRINKIQRRGDRVEIISWLSKNSTPEYAKAVTTAKMKWLAKHLPSVNFDNIYIVAYGTPKSTVTKAKNAVLFDDEMPNIKEWLNNYNEAYTPDKIFEIMA